MIEQEPVPVFLRCSSGVPTTYVTTKTAIASSVEVVAVFFCYGAYIGMKCATCIGNKCTYLL